MSIFEKLGFKKKETKIERPRMEDAPLGDMPPMREHRMPDLGRPEPMPESPRFSRPLESPEPKGNRSLDLINSKLDTIRAILDNINARIEKLEKIAAGEEEVPKWR